MEKQDICEHDRLPDDIAYEAMAKSKMYILVKSSIDGGHAIVAATHASLGGYLHFVEFERSQWGFDRCKFMACGKKTLTEGWADQSFRKVVCSVTDGQFEEAKTYGVAGEDFRVITESSLDGMEVAIVFRPRVQWEPFFKGLPLWGEKRGTGGQA